MPTKTGHRLAAVCGVSLLLAGAAVPPAHQSLSLFGIVESLDGKRVSHVRIRIAGLAEAETSDSGEFDVKDLPTKLQPGWPILLSVEGWVITDPYVGQRGRTFMPNPQVVVEPLPVKVARQGDARLLAASSVKLMLEEAASILDLKEAPAGDHLASTHLGPAAQARPARSLGRTKTPIILLVSTGGPSANPLVAVAPDHAAAAASPMLNRVTVVPASPGFLAAKAPELGFSPEQFRSAVDQWGRETHDPYEKGLKALQERRFADAAHLIEDSLRSNPEGKAERFISLATAESIQLHYAAAERALRQAGGQQTNNTTVLNNLGVVLTEEGRFNEAEAALKRALEINEITLGEGSAEVARNIANLARAYRAQGEYSMAALFDQKALAAATKAYGNESHSVALALRNLARTTAYQGKLTDAAEFATRALAIDEHLFGGSHPSIAADLNALAEIKFRQGKYDESETLYQRVIAIQEKEGVVLDDQERAVALNSLALAYTVRARYQEAQLLFKESLEIYEKILGPDHPDVALVLNNLGRVYVLMKAYSPAEGLFRRALQIDEKSLGADSVEAAACLLNLGHLFMMEKEYDLAQPLVERAFQILNTRAETDNLIRALNMLAGIYTYERRFAAAEPLYNRAIAIAESEHLDDSLAVILSGVGTLYFDEDKFEDAERVYRKSLSLTTQTLGPNHPRVAKAAENLALTLKKLGRLDEARQLTEQAKKIREQQ